MAYQYRKTFSHTRTRDLLKPFKIKLLKSLLFRHSDCICNVPRSLWLVRPLFSRRGSTDGFVLPIHPSRGLETRVKTTISGYTKTMMGNGEIPKSARVGFYREREKNGQDPGEASATRRQSQRFLEILLFDLKPLIIKKKLVTLNTWPRVCVGQRKKLFQNEKVV